MLEEADGVTIISVATEAKYALPIHVVGEGNVYVSRSRKDDSI